MTTRHLKPDAALPIGIEIGGHAIEAVVAVGETGFVYGASDPLLARQVAIKEYFPPALAVRHAGTQMRARNASDHKLVMQGRDAFIEESRLLARLDHPALVRVIGAHEAHQTAFRVMPFLAGPTLAQARLERGVPPGDAWVLRLLDDLLGALQVLHDAGIVHGYVHPAQVLLKPDDRPLLLGFGAAARTLHRGVDTAWLPPELLDTESQQQRGPWTDLHALAATAWFAVMGTAPPAGRPGDVRAAFDAAFGPPQDDEQASIRSRLCGAVARALSPKPADRPQTVTDLRELLGADDAAEEAPRKPVELPPEPDPRVRAAIAAAVASIPDLEPVAMDGRGPAPSEPADGPTLAKEPVPMAGLAPSYVPDDSPVAPERTPGAAGPLFGRAAPEPQVRAAAARPVTDTIVEPIYARTAPESPREPDLTRPREEGREAAVARAVPPPLAEAARVRAMPEPRTEPGIARPTVEPRAEPAFARVTPEAQPEPAFARTVPPEPRPEPRSEPPTARSEPLTARSEPLTARPEPLSARAPAQAPAQQPASARAAPSRQEPSFEPGPPRRAAPDTPAAEPPWASTAPRSWHPPGSTGERYAEPPFAAEDTRPPEPDVPARARPMRRHTGWAWATAVVVGVATGVMAWQWTELRQRDGDRVAAVDAPAATDRSTTTGTPDTKVAPRPAPAQAPAPRADDPTVAAPTAAGPTTRDADAPPGGTPTAAAAQAPAAAPRATPAEPAPPPADERVAAVGNPSAPPVAQETVPERSAGTPARASSSRPPPRPAAPPPRRTAAAPEAAALSTPRAACGTRANFSLVYCMQQQCRRPAFSAHPQCREFRRTGEVN